MYKLGPKINEKLSNNGLQDEIHLGIYFGTILVDFGHQVGGHVPPRRPKMAQLGGQDGPTGAQDAVKNLLRRLK